VLLQMCKKQLLNVHSKKYSFWKNLPISSRSCNISIGRH